MTRTDDIGVFLDRAPAVFFALFLFCSAFSIVLSQVALGLALGAFVVIALQKRYQPFVGWLGYFWAAAALWAGWLCISSILGPAPLRSLLMCRQEWLFSVVVIGVFLFRRARHGPMLMVSLAAGVILISLYGLIQFFTGVTWFSSCPPVPAPVFGYRLTGTFAGNVTFGNYFAVASAGLLGYAMSSGVRDSRLHWRVVLAAGIMGGLVTILSFSRSAIAALVGSVVIMLAVIGHRRWKLSVAVVIILLASLVFIPGVGDRFVGHFSRDFGGRFEGGRVFIWKTSLKVIAENPLTGVGASNFQEAYAGHLRPDVSPIRRITHAHNDFLHAAAIAGLPGSLAFTLLWLAALGYLSVGYVRCRRHGPAERLPYLAAALGASLCFLGTSMYHGTFADEEVRQLLMFFWGGGLAAFCYGRRAAPPVGS
ncbi:MAG TPA: O-antigen ligase family protein [Acidobacteriota bacterium]|nr:O-antigen ligase family protein [Acidobacteriota bacterium]